jgi:nicotinate-nucleotide pyrophosphorylase (carboxylating)
MNLAYLPEVSRLIDLAIAEDLGRGDVTTQCLFDGDGPPQAATVVAREALVVCGVDVAREVLGRIDPRIAVSARLGDGQDAPVGAALLDIDGPAVSILSGERVVLNFLQRLSGIATLARRFAEAVAGTGARVVDTRKTTPGWRVLEKAAVRAGGCGNHRADLASGLLIKDNHIRACGGVAVAVRMARQKAPHSLRVEVEVTSAAELDQAISAQADVVLLDNMSIDEVTAATVLAHRAGLLVEVSGGIDLERAPLYAAAGVDLISVGALTHSARAVDIALDFS